MAIWRKGTGARELFPLEGHMTDLALLNDANQIVFCEMHESHHRWLRRFLHPWRRCSLWDPNLGVIPLDSYVGAGRKKIFYPMEINNQGCIVGVLESGRKGRAVLLEPIPRRWGK